MIDRSMYLLITVLFLVQLCFTETIPINSSLSRSGTGGSIPASASYPVGTNAPTVNALSATLKWWYSKTAQYGASTIQIQFNQNDSSTGWTVFAARTQYNVSTAISTSSCGSPYYYTYSSSTFTQPNCTTRTAHVAAQTSAVYVTAFKTPNVTQAYNTSIPDLRTSPSPAVVTVGPNVFSTGTPFVQFSKYEVVNCAASSCNAATYALATPYAFTYSGPDPASANNVDASITGSLDPQFVQYINRTSLIPGSWTAPPTVVVVVDLVIVAIAVLAMSFPPSATTLMVPSPTLPPGYSYIPPSTTSPPITPGPATARVEITQQFLLLPDSSSVPASKIADQLGPTTTGQSGPITTPASIAEYIVEGQTISAGGNALVLYDQTLSEESNGVLLWMQGYRVSTVAPPSQGVFSVEGMQITVRAVADNPNSAATSGDGHHGTAGSVATAKPANGLDGPQPSSTSDTAAGGSMTTTAASTASPAGSGSGESSSVPNGATHKDMATTTTLLSLSFAIAMILLA